MTFTKLSLSQYIYTSLFSWFALQNQRSPVQIVSGPMTCHVCKNVYRVAPRVHGIKKAFSSLTLILRKVTVLERITFGDFDRDCLKCGNEYKEIGVLCSVICRNKLLLQVTFLIH